MELGQQPRIAASCSECRPIGLDALFCASGLSGKGCAACAVQTECRCVNFGQSR